MKRVLVLAVLAVACGGGAKPTSEPTTPPASAEQAEDSPATAPEPSNAVAEKPATGASGCGAEALKEEGMQHINRGQHAAALVSFEKSLECADDPYVRQLAFMESCASGNSKKARHYAKQLTADQREKFGQICVRQRPPVRYE